MKSYVKINVISTDNWFRTTLKKSDFTKWCNMNMYISIRCQVPFVFSIQYLWRPFLYLKTTLHTSVPNIKYCKSFCRQSNLIRYNRNHNSQTLCMQIRVCERILPFFFSFSDPQTHIPKMIMASIYMEYIFE